MGQIFHRSTNTLSRVSIFGAVFFLALIVIRFLSTGLVRTMVIVTNAFVAVALAISLVLVSR